MFSTEELQTPEDKYIKNVLKYNGYPEYHLYMATRSTKLKAHQRENTIYPKRFVTHPYVKGTSEELRRIFQIRGVHFTPVNTPWQSVVNMKDPTRKMCRTV